MRYGSLLALPIALAPVPAQASASIDCETTDGSGIHLIVNLPRDDNHIEWVQIEAGGETLRTDGNPPRLRLAYSALTRRTIHLDLLDAVTNRPDTQLRTIVNEEGDAVGTLTRLGREHPVQCLFG
jgi:hypothetical protein